MTDEREFTLGEILEAHRVERLGFPGHVKCHACDDWTSGTIHDHHADLAVAYLKFAEIVADRDRLAAEEALSADYDEIRAWKDNYDGMFARWLEADTERLALKNALRDAELKIRLLTQEAELAAVPEDER